MKLLRVLHGFLPRVRLRPIRNMTLDLRDPLVAHRVRRRQECRKAAPPRTYLPVIPAKSVTARRLGVIEGSRLERMLMEPAFMRHQAE